MRVDVLFLVGLLAAGEVASKPLAPEEPRWCGALPIKFYMTPTVPLESQELIRQGIHLWDEQGVGVVFVEVTRARDIDKDTVLVYWDSDVKSKLCGYAPDTVNLPGCIRGRAVILFENCGNYMRDGWEKMIAAHEVGHVLGLVHTTDKSDLMNPIAYEGQGFTDYEREQLLRRYGAKE